MANSKDIYKLQPGATYSVKIVPKGSSLNDPSVADSFATTFTVPTTNADGTPINTTNSTTGIQLAASGYILAGDPQAIYDNASSEYEIGRA
jgi:hypothetical protein